MRGILLIWQKMKININHGYMPLWWSDQDINDVKAALRYLGRLYDWYESFHKKEEHDAE
jgi:hypothetical protein